MPLLLSLLGLNSYCMHCCWIAIGYAGLNRDGPRRNEPSLNEPSQARELHQAEPPRREPWLFSPRRDNSKSNLMPYLIKCVILYIKYRILYVRYEILYHNPSHGGYLDRLLELKWKTGIQTYLMFTCLYNIM